MIETSMVWNGMVEPTVNHEYAEVQVHDMVPFHAAPAVPRSSSRWSHGRSPGGPRTVPGRSRETRPPYPPTLLFILASSLPSVCSA
mgnify:CR=1 FL=1